jgi:O-glycosyl hydrolase
MNEPDTSYWGVNSVKQEGCHFDPGDSQSKAIIETRKALDNAGLTDVLVAGMDETSIDKSVTNYAKLSDEAKTDLGRIDTHTYSGSNRSGLKSTAISANKNLWMSEVDGGWNGFGLAERIITDMNGMQPSAWVMWDIVDKHKDSDFTTPDGTKSEASATLSETDSLWGVGMADHDTETLYLANKYYFFGQFTKYINPGDTIIASSNTTLAAYNRQSGDIKIVALNSSSSDAKYEFDMSAFKTVGNTASIIRSNNSDEKWKNVGTVSVTDKTLSYTLPAQSITTFVIENSAAVTEFSADANGMKYSYDTPTAYDGYDKYFAVYDSSNNLKYLSSNKNSDTVSGDFSNCTFKLLVWDSMKPVTDAITTVTAESAYSDEYAIIKGVGNQISRDSTVTLSLSTNMEGTPVWSSSDETVATVTQDGTVTAVGTGEVTITVTIGTFTTSRTFEIPKYILTGSASWGNDSNRPADSADYTQVADGDFSTYFDGTTGGYVQYDFGEIVKATSIRLAARSGNGMPERTVGGTIQGSYDGINWDDLYKITTAIPSDEYTTISSSQLTGDTYRYFRYTNSDNMANIAEFLIDTEELTEPVTAAHAVISDITELTDNFEGNTNIFNAKSGAISDGGAVVFASGLDRFGKVFAPVKTTATATVASDITLTSKDKFRLTFNMFAGWESSGKDNTFALKDKDGNEIVALYMTGGGYNFNQIRIGGTNVLSDTTIAQSRSNPGTSKAGANGWNASGQPYVNTV